MLVIGAGPAGLMAARAAARAGADVILADEDARMGGRLLAETEEVDGQPGHAWAAEVVAELAAMDNVRLMPRTAVTGAYDQGTYGALERVGQHHPHQPGKPLECFWRIVARRAILCAGALERPVAFPNNDRPGIMTAGAVRAYLNRWGVVAGRKVAVFANNDGAHRTAMDLMAAGVDVSAVIDSRAEAQALGDYKLFAGARVIGTRGPQGAGKPVAAPGRPHPADRGRVPGRLGRLEPFGPPGLPHERAARMGRGHAQFPAAGRHGAGHDVAGAARGQFSTAACLADGARVAAEVVADLGLTPADTRCPRPRTAPIASRSSGRSRAGAANGSISRTTCTSRT